jgi:tRNA 2-thiouridine synthesizing protein A
MRTPVSTTAETLDLRGVKCPLSWAKAKVRLEGLATGAALDVVMDDPKGVRDIPRAAEAEGYAVLEVREEADGWHLIIQR